MDPPDPDGVPSGHSQQFRKGPHQFGVSSVPCETACVFADMTARRTNIIGPGQSVCYAPQVAALAIGPSESGLAHGDGRLDFFGTEVARPRRHLPAGAKSRNAAITSYRTYGLVDPAASSSDRYAWAMATRSCWLNDTSDPLSLGLQLLSRVSSCGRESGGS